MPGAILPLSPETSGEYPTCPRCGNSSRYVGVDVNGYPGVACWCNGAERGVECTCTAVLRQPFTVGEDAHPDYSAARFADGLVPAGAEVATYHSIECGRCGLVLWQEGEVAP